jgi:catechol 2,3-dioxygenase-like lactoylglutathione lyase family enzyme
MMTSKFKTVSPRLPIADARRTVQFYTERLGFCASLWPENSPTFLLLDRDEVRLAFDVVPGCEPKSRESTCGFYLEVADVLAAHEAIRNHAQVEWGPEVYFYGRREFAIRDPDGYLIIFTEKTDDPPTCAAE